jgi:DNA topoisomerase-3
VGAVATGARATLAVKERMTVPPTHLTESELIGRMEKNGIGTDASIPTHIENILKRNYAELITGRKLMPTQLGLVLANGYHLIDSALVLPKVRADIEGQCDEISRGALRKEDVVQRSLELFEGKFVNFMKNIAKMDVLFGSSFSKLDDVGKAFTRCGLTRRYLQYIEGPPTRLYNRFTETVYPMPGGGILKQWSGKICAIAGCGFELCLYSVGSPTRTFPLCPHCYNNPRKEWGGLELEEEEEEVESDDEVDEKKKKQASIAGRTLVLNCPLPDGHPNIEEITVCPDLENGGVFVVDVTSNNKWSFVSTKAATTLHLGKNVKRVKVLDKRDEATFCRFIEVEFKDGEGDKVEGVEGDRHIGCLLSDPVLQGLIRKR